MVLEKAFTFRPNAVFYVETVLEAQQAADYLARVIRKNVDIPYAYLREVAQRAGLEANMEETAALRRLEPFQNDVLAWLYREIVQECRTRNIVPVWIFLPQVDVGSWQEGTAAGRQLAEEVGFTVVDLGDVYKGHDILSLRLAEWDYHPNTKAHELIASRLYEALREKDTGGALHLFAQAEKP
jgi:hypothetical protein